MFDVLFAAIPTLVLITLAFLRAWLPWTIKCMLGLACFIFAVGLAGLALGALENLSVGMTLWIEMEWSLVVLILSVLGCLWFIWSVRGAVRRGG